MFAVQTIIIIILFIILVWVYMSNIKTTKETFSNCYDYVKNTKQWPNLLRSEIFTLLTLKPEKGTMYNDHLQEYPNDGSCILDKSKLPFYNLNACMDVNMSDCKLNLRDETNARTILNNIYTSYTSVFEKQISSLTNTRNTLEKQKIDLTIKNDNLNTYLAEENAKIAAYNYNDILAEIAGINTQQENISNQLALISLQETTTDDTLKQLNTQYEKYNIILNSRDPAEIQSTLGNSNYLNK